MSLSTTAFKVLVKNSASDTLLEYVRIILPHLDVTQLYKVDDLTREYRRTILHTKAVNWSLTLGGAIIYTGDDTIVISREDDTFKITPSLFGDRYCIDWCVSAGPEQARRSVPMGKTDDFIKSLVGKDKDELMDILNSKE